MEGTDNCTDPEIGSDQLIDIRQVSSISPLPFVPTSDSGSHSGLASRDESSLVTSVGLKLPQHRLEKSKESNVADEPIRSVSATAQPGTNLLQPKLHIMDPVSLRSSDKNNVAANTSTDRKRYSSQPRSSSRPHFLQGYNMESVKFDVRSIPDPPSPLPRQPRDRYRRRSSNNLYVVT